MDIEYLKNLFTKEEIERYSSDSDNIDFDKDNFVIKLQTEFNKFLKEIYTETKIHRSNDIEYMLNQICIFFSNTINLKISYNIISNKSFSLKTTNIIFNVLKNDTNIDWIITDFEEEFQKLLLYILEIKKEINSYITELKNYPYLHQYVNITDYEILLHYSNIDEEF